MQPPPSALPPFEGISAGQTGNQLDHEHAGSLHPHFHSCLQMCPIPVLCGGEAEHAPAALPRGFPILRCLCLVPGAPLSRNPLTLSPQTHAPTQPTGFAPSYKAGQLQASAWSPRITITASPRQREREGKSRRLRSFCVNMRRLPSPHLPPQIHCRKLITAVNWPCLSRYSSGDGIEWVNIESFPTRV